MYTFPFLLLVVYLGARMNSAYHPHLLLKKYVIIKNQTLAKFLIHQSDPVNSGAKNAKANRNKLLYSGIFFYGWFLFLIFLSVVLFFVPDIPVENFTYDSRSFFLTGSTLNIRLPIDLSFALLFAESAFHFINTLKYAVEKTTAKRFVQILYCLFSAFAIMGMVFELWSAIAAIKALF